ncbi:hypothetical protein ABZP36_036179 [Zizania latifolia]
MSRHDDAANQLEGMQEVDAPAGEAAADRQDDIAADDEALVHDRWWAKLEETVMLDMEGPRLGGSVAAAGERAAGGAHDYRFSFGSQAFMGGGFFGDAAATAREHPIQRYVPPPARSGFRFSFPRHAVISGGAGSSSSTPHGGAVASAASPALPGSGAISTVLSMALPTAAPVAPMVSPVVMTSPGDPMVNAPQDVPAGSGAGAGASSATHDFYGGVFPAVPPGSSTTNARRARYLAEAAEDILDVWGRWTAALPVANALPQPQPKSAAADDTPAVVARKEEGRGNVWNDDRFSSLRRVILADSDTPAVFAAMEEGPDNAWYECIIRDAAILDQMEDPEIHGSIPQDLTPSSETPAVVEPESEAASAAGEGGEFSLPNVCKEWGLLPSDLDPEDAGPSDKKRPRVAPLADGDLPVFECGICFETLPILDLFHGLQCGHRFCLECMTTYIEGKVRERDVPIHCPEPECRYEKDGVLHPEHCKKAIDFAAFGDWGLRLAEGAISPNRRAYCPNRQCGIVLETTGEEKPAQAPCPACNLLLCASCGMEWTTGDGEGREHDCAKSLANVLIMKLADERRWKQCPSCRMMVERIAGCRVMHCRCHMVFCYQCGLQMSPVTEGNETCRCHNVFRGHL